MKWKACFTAALFAVLLSVPAWGQVTYDVDPKVSSDGVNPVPDVDKAGLIQGQPVPPGPGPAGGPAGPDLGCWTATASNILGAAGWGTGANPQAKADSIYQDLVNQFEVNPGDGYIAAAGNCAAAAKWWVHNVGLNSAKAGQGYDPTNPYVDFGLVERTLAEPDYNYLLDELARCQYVGVTWITGGDTGHCMTLVGGNYGPNGPPGLAPPDVSVWHNSDNEGLGTDDEVYGNDWNANPPTWYLDVSGDGVGDWFADGYFKACPGHAKPAGAVGNYDVHYYRGPDHIDNTGPVPLWVDAVQMLVTGDNKDAYAGPQGGTQPEWDPSGGPTLYVPNEEIDDLYKILYLLVDFKEPLPAFAQPEDLVGAENFFDIQVLDEEGEEVPLDEYWLSSDNGQVLLKYVFDDQPDWEQIVFPHLDYKDLTGNILEWNLATECVPEPASLALLAAGAAAALLRRRRQRT